MNISLMYNLRTPCFLYMDGHITGNELRDRLILVLREYRDDGKYASDITVLAELIIGDKNVVP